MRELSLHILDLLQNSLEANASRIELILVEDSTDDFFSITVIDTGRGMDAFQIARATDPFFTTRNTRHVGLGIPLLAAAAEHCGGALSLESAPGVGTTVKATFQHSHIDRVPLGNIRDTLLAFMLADSGDRACDLHYRHRVDDKEFEFDTADIRRELKDVPLSHPKVRNWLKEFVAEGERSLYEPMPSDS